jgi:predicted amidophosphoribosyltransferase
MLSPFISWLCGSLEILLPRECLVCGRPLRGASLCFRCTPPPPPFSSLAAARCPRCFVPHSPRDSSEPCETCRLYPPLFLRSRCLWEYSGLTRDLIRAMKYRPSMYLARRCGETLAESLPKLFPGATWDVIVPVPGSGTHFRKRLFHPCSLIARVVGRAHGIPVIECLARSSRRAPQASLSHEQRLTGQRNFFRARGSSAVAGCRVLLVEDVITTGATSAAAVRALLKTGAATVDVLAVARTSVWTRFRRRVYESLGWLDTGEVGSRPAHGYKLP